MEIVVKREKRSCNEFMNTLERNVAILKIENQYNSKIGYELETKLTWFNNLSRGLVDKLDSLRKLSEAHPLIGNEIKQFVEQISHSWTSIKHQICAKYSKIRMASQTLHGVPLSLILDKMRIEINSLKTSLKINELVYNQEYISKGYKLITECEELIFSLKKCDSKLQQYLSITNITPYLIKLESAIDKYVTNSELLPTNELFVSDLSIFLLVTKLLTGELLGQEYVDPNFILLENVPRKPVFIIKNTKRKAIYSYYPT